MGHIVLLGDSIFDNGRYVPGGPPLIEQLRSRLLKDWTATLLAMDGAVVEDVPRQISRLPAAATHLVISAGGNDALGNRSLLVDATRSAAEGFASLGEIQEQFRREYHEMVGAVLAEGKPTTLCTIYDAIPGLPPHAVSGLSVFNDVILRAGFRAGLPILDLRLICDVAGDYSSVSPIEPSKLGGFKIARAISRVVTEHDFSRRESVVYGHGGVE